MFLPSDHSSAGSYFAFARENVVNSAYHAELDWQRSQTLNDLTQEEFLRETAWVILNSGFREMTARKLFPQISLAFFDWADSRLILESRETCIDIAQRTFAHRPKLRAMADAAEFLERRGVQELSTQLEIDPISLLSSMSYIGPVTAWHLAKNLGCDVAKPDRHLVRIADHFGYPCVHTLCRELSEDYDEKISVVDLILWRFSATGISLLRAS